MEDAFPQIEEPPEPHPTAAFDADDDDVPADVAELREAVGQISVATARTLRAVARCAETGGSWNSASER